MSKENYTYKKRPIYEKRPTHIKRDLLSSSHHASLLISYPERDLHIPKETYIYQQRPIYMKKDLLKSSHHVYLPLSRLKEAYIYQKKFT